MIHFKPHLQINTDLMERIPIQSTISADAMQVNKSNKLNRIIPEAFVPFTHIKWFE